MGNFNSLELIKDLFKNAIEDKKGDSFKILNEVADWIFTNWTIMTSQVKTNRAVFDLCQHNQSKNKGNESQDKKLIALHSVIEEKNFGGFGSELVDGGEPIATLLVF